MFSENWTDVSYSSLIDIYDLGSGPCVELFRPNQKLLEKDLSGYSWVDDNIMKANYLYITLIR